MMLQNFASLMPTPAAAGQPTAAELVLMKEWIKEDAQMKVIIGRRLSPIIQNILGEKLTARQQWEMLSKRFIPSRCHFPIQTSIPTLLQKTERPRQCFTLSWFAEMGITFTDIFLKRPKEWRGKHHSEVNKEENWKDIAAAATDSKTTPAPPSSSTETSALTASSSHMRDWSCTIAEELDTESLLKDEDITCITSQMLSTILDSGTTSTLITNQSYFWTYDSSAKVTVKTANHGKLATSG
ncbi:uncharacterized protein EDB91DRAFT_1081112 [Suillus paluster]|uniref:uncharacterized protein n=1 Tax=Suillus paluster TaxID=48578 RepID=UPI001B86837D|nr:uncharacterized protein EDB91DRAFT_1081112 [Suillus paluster]KAG1743744.1 hypothetical protein EDB91DRAFT_1081112 [Suillus paluster]